MQPLAVAVVGGLTVSMLLTLFVVPCAYIVMHGAGDRVAAWLTGSRGEKGQAPAPAPDPS
jgi:hypothetical protein